MKKKLILPFCIFSIVLVSCGTSSSDSSSSQDLNNAPIFSGVSDEVSIHLGETWNALEGVQVLDEEDGDITSRIIITSIPALVNNDGVLFPDSQGEYYITFSVKDNANEITEAYTTLFVNAPLPTETVYQSFDFTEDRHIDLHDWQLANVGSASSTTNLEQETLTINIADFGDEESSITFYKDNIPLMTAAKHQLKISAKSTDVSMAITVSDQSAEPGGTHLLSSETLTLSPSFDEYIFDFTPEIAVENAKISIEFTGQSLKSPTQVNIEKIRFSVAHDEGSSVVLINDDFASVSSSWAYNTNEGAVATLNQEDESLHFSIDQFAIANKPWNINLYRSTTSQVEKGALYRLTIDISSVENQFYELCIENQQLDWQIRAGFSNGTLVPDTQSIEMVFEASMSIENVYIKLALGQGSSINNVLTIDNFVFEELTTQIFNDDFYEIIAPVAWRTYNVEGGVGTIESIDNTLVYSITQLGTADWHNKVTFESLELAGQANYRFEFAISASIAAKGLFFVNKSGVWEPKIEETLDFSTSIQTYSFQFDQILYVDETVELLYQFGGFAENIAPFQVTFHSLTIYQIN